MSREKSISAETMFYLLDLLAMLEQLTLANLASGDKVRVEALERLFFPPIEATRNPAKVRSVLERIIEAADDCRLIVSDNLRGVNNGPLRRTSPKTRSQNARAIVEATRALVLADAKQEEPQRPQSRLIPESRRALRQALALVELLISHSGFVDQVRRDLVIARLDLRSKLQRGSIHEMCHNVILGGGLALEKLDGL
jgi:hypothetical protein